MRELLYEAAKHYRRGRALADRGDDRAAAIAYEEALRDLHAVRPQRMRDVLLAQVYLSRHQLEGEAPQRAADLRMGYGYARTTAEPSVRALAERLWRDAIERGEHRAARIPAPRTARPPAAAPALSGGRPGGGGRPATVNAAETEGGARSGRRRGRRRSGRKAPRG